MNADTILDMLDTIINRDDYTRAQGITVLNELQKWIQNKGNWSFMEYEDTDQTTVDGTQAYTIPTRFKTDIGVSLVNSSNQQRFLHEWRSEQAQKGIGTTNQESRPTHYEYFAGELLLYDIPDVTGETIKQRCYRYLAALTDSDSSTNEITANHGWLLICGAAREIFNIFEDYEAAAVWDTGPGKGGHNFFSEWNAFKAKEAKKQDSSGMQRVTMRVK